MPPKITPRATLIRVQELHDAGNSFRKIAEILAAEGVPAAGTRSKWHHDSVRGCLEQIEQRSESSATWGLSPQIRARLAAQGEEIEGLTVAGVQRLGTGIQETVARELRAIERAAAAQTTKVIAELRTIQDEAAAQTTKVKAELRTIQGAAERQAGLVRGAMGRLSLWLVGAAVAIGLGVAGVAWAAGEWMESSLKGYQAEIAQAEKLIAELEEKTGGLEYLETEGGRWLIWPEAGEPYKATDGRFAGRWVVKLKDK